MLHTVVLLHITVKTVTRWHLDSLKGKVNIMLQNIYISNKGCSLEIFVHQRILNIYLVARLFLTLIIIRNVSWAANYYSKLFQTFDQKKNLPIDVSRFSLQRFRIDSELSFNQMCDDAEFDLETPCILLASNSSRKIIFHKVQKGWSWLQGHSQALLHRRSVKDARLFDVEVCGLARQCFPLEKLDEVIIYVV